MATGTGAFLSATRALTCLFWNVNRRDRRDLITRLVVQEHADVLVLAEHDLDNETMLGALRREVDVSFVEPPASTPRLHLFARSRSLDLHETYGDVSGRLTIRVLSWDKTEILLAAAHLPIAFRLVPAG